MSTRFHQYLHSFPIQILVAGSRRATFLAMGTVISLVIGQILLVGSVFPPIEITALAMPVHGGMGESTHYLILGRSVDSGSNLGISGVDEDHVSAYQGLDLTTSNTFKTRYAYRKWGEYDAAVLAEDTEHQFEAVISPEMLNSVDLAETNHASQVDAPTPAPTPSTPTPLPGGYGFDPVSELVRGNDNEQILDSMSDLSPESSSTTPEENEPTETNQSRASPSGGPLVLAGQPEQRVAEVPPVRYPEEWNAPPPDTGIFASKTRITIMVVLLLLVVISAIGVVRTW